MLKVDKLVTSYGVIKALKGVSLQVRTGELVTLVGANGAGKSTLLKAILGMVTINAGSILYKGRELAGMISRDIIAQGIAIVPEGRKIFGDLTVEENLQLGTFARKKDPVLDKEILEFVYTSFPRLYERRRQHGGTLSGGEQQMLAVSRALMSKPDLLLLDEPSMGLAPVIIESVFEIIMRLKSQGQTMLLVEQNAMQALHVSDRAYILNTGKVEREDSSDNIMADDSLRMAYLGVKE